MIARNLIDTIIGATLTTVILTLCYLIVWILPQRYIRRQSTKANGPVGKDALDLEIKLRDVLIKAVALGLSLVGIWIGWQQFMLKQESERYAKAVEMMSSEQVSERVAGIYLLEPLAQESPKSYYWKEIELLKALIELRGRSHMPSTEIPEKRLNQLLGEYKIPLDVQAAMTVLGRRNLQNERYYSQVPNGLAKHNELDKIDNNRRSNVVTGRPWLDFAQLDFSGARLDNTNFEGVSFTDCKFSFCTWQDSNLRQSQFTRCEFCGCTLDHSNLDNTNFNAVLLTYSSLVGISGQELEFTSDYENNAYACIIRCDMGRALLVASKFESVYMSCVNFSGAKFMHTSWRMVYSYRDLELPPTRYPLNSLVLKRLATSRNALKANFIDLSATNMSGAKLEVVDLGYAILRWEQIDSWYEPKVVIIPSDLVTTPLQKERAEKLRVPHS